MKSMKKVDYVFTWIIFGLFVLHLISYFLPFFESKSSGGKPELVYFYGGGSFYINSNIINYLIPFIAIVFLFSKFKHGKLFFFGFSAAYLLSNIFVILSISKSASSDSSYYEYSLKFGYYFFIVTLVLLAISILCSFIFYLMMRSEDSNEESEQTRSSSPVSKIYYLRKKIEILDDLKNQGVLTETEYEQKRSEIIAELKL